MATLERISGYDVSRVLLLVGYRLVGVTGSYACTERGGDALMGPSSELAR